MTEADMIARAKMYMEQLASGINPLTGQPLQSGECAAEERMRRCFEYTASVLDAAYRREIDREIKANRRCADEFNLTAEQIARYELSNEPIGLTAIRERFNSLVDISVTKRLKITAFTAFLIASGLIEEVDGIKRPTEEGRRMGIYEIERENLFSGHKYTQLVYSNEVQRFMLDNIDSLSAYNSDHAVRKAVNRGDL